ncbi:MAG: ABC transporter ATP-binding protein [Defluviitaleaceae bacterium]|nr:ABC transporter ATP-binding protein [Defluviitaleaceae bacterium]
MHTNNLIQMKSISKTFEMDDNAFEALKNIDINIKSGEFVAIIGPSGSGKSTLMNLIGLLDTPSSGQYTLSNIDTTLLNQKELANIRNKKIGFVFQSFNLIPRASALRNVEIPMFYAGIAAAERRKRAIELLKLVEMESHLKHHPSQLSGGQKQRVAIARALANDPDIILADEPTGALDTATGRLIMDIFHDLNKNHGKTIILVTHNENLAKEAGAIIALKDGEVTLCSKASK